MGQSFLTHDEKSSGSPSPDLLQFSGAPAPPKSFRSLSSGKGSSTISSSSPSVDSERSISVSNPSPSPPQTTTTDNDSGHAGSYSFLVPTPILPGSVSRLREKFLGRQGSFGTDPDVLFKNESGYTREAFPQLDYRTLGRSAMSPASYNGDVTTQASFSPSPSRRSVPALVSPTSFRNLVPSRSRTLPATPTAYEKLDVVRSDADLAECFRHMTLASTCKRRNLSNFSAPLVRYHRPRARSHVPQLRSVIVREGFLPELQTVNRFSGPSGAGNKNDSGISPENASEDVQDNRDVTNDRVASSHAVLRDRLKIEDTLVASAPSSSSRQKQRLEERTTLRVVTNPKVIPLKNFATKLGVFKKKV